MVETEESQIAVLGNPNLSKNLSYITNTKEVYVNLFKITLKKNLTLYEYPFKITPEIDKANELLKNKIFKRGYRKFRAVYDECFQSGDFIYSMKEIKTQNTFTVILYMGEKYEYTVDVLPFQQQTVIDLTNVDKDPKTKQSIELMIKDILHSNPNLDFYKNLFVNHNDRKTIKVDKIQVNFYPGFTTSFMLTEKGSFLNVTLKNKILSTETILDYLNKERYTDKRNQKKIKENLIGRSFKVSYAKRNYIINDITFEKTVKTMEFPFEGKNISLFNYYKKHYNITIENLDQPLIMVIRKDPQDNETTLYFVPELCHLGGLDDTAIKNGKFMKELAMYTKLIPAERVKKTNQFLNLLESTEKKKGKDGKSLPSAKEKTEYYGFDIEPVKENFTACYMTQPMLIAGKNKPIKMNDKVFQILKPIAMEDWLFLYEKHNYNDADNFWNNLQKASKGYGIKISEPEWVEMNDRSNNAEDWTETVNDYMKKNKYQFVLFFLDRNDFIYKNLKKHSLSEKGYISQVVKTFSIRKNTLSVCSKILIQLNNKLGGETYRVDFKKIINKLNIMAVGVDSSHIPGKRTGVAMTATINNNFTEMYNGEEIIEEKNKEQLQFCVAKFLKDAVKVFVKKVGSIDGIVIYRQGVSLQQKDFLENEEKQIDLFCKDNKIRYYYILVNTKSTYKFFETDKNQTKFANPAPGFLMFKEVTNPNLFEFYMQPQQVTGGSATPTCYNVHCGDLNQPEMIMYLTYGLCQMYANWQGPVRIPNVIKNAEKLSKMTAKYTKDTLHQNLILGQSYL
jgi:aubergine-like protein